MTARHWLVAAASGLLFGAGLTLSGMVDPLKVLGFLDVAGRWDPTLVLVLAGAVGVNVVGYRLVLRRRAPWLAERFVLPTATKVDRPLVAGAVLFGVGWGLVGYCPGPALAALPSGAPKVALFVAAMVAGSLLARFLTTRRRAGVA